MISSISGIVLGLIIGGACRWFDLPLPAPPKLVGAILVVAMSLGFVGTGSLNKLNIPGVFYEQTEARSTYTR
ncbi:DUF1427 family protein [Microbulbifer rhizosphaerae]|uniref:DUF1427 family protein n=1 Tax=Microbulbifer rhizosphaerae TaxID=1562603 RepID=UPI00160A1883